MILFDIDTWHLLVGLLAKRSLESKYFYILSLRTQAWRGDRLQFISVSMSGFLFLLGFGLVLPSPVLSVVTLDSRNFEEETSGKTVFIKYVRMSSV